MMVGKGRRTLWSQKDSFHRHISYGPPVGGRLHFYADSWEKFDSPWCVSILRHGYTIPLMEKPFIPPDLPDFYGPTGMESLIDAHVLDLLEKNAVYQIKDLRDVRRGFTSPLLLVRKKSGSYRPCLDLRHINAVVEYNKFKMEALKELKQMLLPGDFMTSLDLKDGYFHIPVSSTSQPLLQFRWKGNYYRFSALPFGLSSAPLVFTKMLRPVIRYLRARGIRLMAYLDDIIILARSREESLRITREVRCLLESIGWLINYEKSSLVPSTSIEYLGFLVDTFEMKLFVPGGKRKQFRNSCVRMLRSQDSGKSSKLRTLASVVGKLQSLAPAVPFCRLHLQDLVQVVRHRLKGERNEFRLWESMVKLSSRALDELRWWIEWLREWNGNSVLYPQTQLDIYSDASNTGYGGAVSKKFYPRAPTVVQGFWTVAERAKSINEREMIAAERVLKAFLKWHRLQDLSIRLFTDSVVACTYLNNMGGKFAHLRAVARRILEICELRKVRLVVEHLQGIHNVVADRLSRWPMDRSDWSLNRTVFSYLDRRWGPHSIDFFATRNNAQLPRFVSWAADDAATYVDALQNLHRKENGYANPPFAVIGQVLEKLWRTSRELTIIVPAWPGQPWWPRLLEMLSDTPVLLPDIPDLFIPPKGAPGQSTQPPWRVLACRVSGRSSKRAVYLRRVRKLLLLDGDYLLKKILLPFDENGSFSSSTRTALVSILENIWFRSCSGMD